MNACDIRDLVFESFEHQTEYLESEKCYLEVEVLALSDICKSYRQDQENFMGENETTFSDFR